MILGLFYRAVRYKYDPKILVKFCNICRNCSWRAYIHDRAKVTVFSHPFRNLLENGSTYVGLNAALCGLIANSLFDASTRDTGSYRAAGLPMAVIPFLTATTYKGFVSLPLNTGKFYFPPVSSRWYTVCTLHQSLK